MAIKRGKTSIKWFKIKTKIIYCRDEERQLLWETKDKLDRWARYFKQLLITAWNKTKLENNKSASEWNASHNYKIWGETTKM